MDSGYYAACAGLRTQSQALEVIADNLANLNTNGYRGQLPTFRSLLAKAQGTWIGPLNQTINEFNVINGTRLDLNPGNLERTGNPLDLAIEGNGFFAAQTPRGIHYTRNGHFEVSTTGRLTTLEGDPVLDEQSRPLLVPPGNVSISADGTISVEGAVAGKMRLVEFAQGTQVTPEGNSYYSAPQANVLPSPSSYVRQGMLESSNVGPVPAVVTLIAVQRHAEMMQRALSVYYSEFNRIAANDLPKV